MHIKNIVVYLYKKLKLNKMKKVYFEGTKIKEFKTQKDLDNFFEKNKNRYLMKEVFINNSFGVEYKQLLKF